MYVCNSRSTARRESAPRSSPEHLLSLPFPAKRPFRRDGMERRAFAAPAQRKHISFSPREPELQLWRSLVHLRRTCRNAPCNAVSIEESCTRNAGRFAPLREYRSCPRDDAPRKGKISTGLNAERDACRCWEWPLLLLLPLPLGQRPFDSCERAACRGERKQTSGD